MPENEKEYQKTIMSMFGKLACEWVLSAMIVVGIG